LACMLLNADSIAELRRLKRHSHWQIKQAFVIKWVSGSKQLRQHWACYFVPLHDKCAE
jgi:hypothetical protein